MKRRAYIGLSSPTAYYYDHDQRYFKEEWRWNPILESPQGLITLFDELWFLNRSLCPISFRNEKYVKYIDEDSDFKPLIKHLTKILTNDGLDGLLKNYPLINQILKQDDTLQKQFNRYQSVISGIYGGTSNDIAPIDNHSHSINLLGESVSGNSISIDLLAFDIAFLYNAGINNIELISNSFNSNALITPSPTNSLLKVSEGVTIKRIPTLQTPVGPIIDNIDKIRESNFLVDFRTKILQNNNPDDFIDLVNNIELEFKNYRNEVLLEKQRSSRILNSISKNAFSFGIGLLVPGVGEIKSLATDNAARKYNWTGFIAEIET